jgi:hypothetical protein
MTTTLPFTPNISVKPEVAAFFDKDTNTFSYVVKDPDSRGLRDSGSRDESGLSVRNNYLRRC